MEFVKLIPINRICPCCGNGNYMRIISGKYVGELNVKCINCNSYYNYDELLKRDNSKPLNGAEGGDTVELKPCPLCGSASVSRISREGYGRRSKPAFGRLCSNPKCEWSYAYTPFATQEQADKEWNKKVDRKEQMLEWSRRLKPCSCGGTAFLIHENYGGNYGLWFVRCDKCQKLLTALESMDAIIEAWNRRANDG